jgi:FkbM family methyltransferase
MYRKRTYPELAKRILGKIFRHPIAGREPAKYLMRGLIWQVRKRLIGRPVDRRLAWGHVLRCYPDSGSASNVVYFSEFFDFDEMGFVSRYLRLGDAAIDGGANIGVYSLLFASIVGPTGRVDAFEPDATAFARLEENIRLNRLDFVHPHNTALGDQQTSVLFYEDSDVSNRVATGIDAGRRIVTVPMTRLSAFVDHRAYALAKLDLEGYEPHALRGMKDSLASGNPEVLLLEVIPNLLEKAGSSPKELCDYLKALGYGLYSYSAADRGLAPTSRSVYGPGNVLAIRDLRVVEDRLRSPSTGDAVFLRVAGLT